MPFSRIKICLFVFEFLVLISIAHQFPINDERDDLQVYFSPQVLSQLLMGKLGPRQNYPGYYSPNYLRYSPQYFPNYPDFYYPKYSRYSPQYFPSNYPVYPPKYHPQPQYPRYAAPAIRLPSIPRPAAALYRPFPFFPPNNVFPVSGESWMKKESVKPHHLEEALLHAASKLINIESAKNEDIKTSAVHEEVVNAYNRLPSNNDDHDAEYSPSINEEHYFKDSQPAAEDIESNKPSEDEVLTHVVEKSVHHAYEPNHLAEKDQSGASHAAHEPVENKPWEDEIKHAIEKMAALMNADQSHHVHDQLSSDHISHEHKPSEDEVKHVENDEQVSENVQHAGHHDHTAHDEAVLHHDDDAKISQIDTNNDIKKAPNNNSEVKPKRPSFSMSMPIQEFFVNLVNRLSAWAESRRK